MKWLQWATVDLENGFGGVEIHSRSLHRELRSLGVDSYLSNNPKDLLENDWDVIHTHGSCLSIKEILKSRSRRKNKAILAQGLHGTTLGRMAACHEWFWPGGYLASNREIVGVSAADIVFSDHPNLWLYKMAKTMGKHCAVLSNGWDSFSTDSTSLPKSIQDELEKQKPYWLFLGRGSDVVKNVDGLLEAFKLAPELNLVAVPGHGFEKASEIFKPGFLSSYQVKEVLTQSQGLVISSHYEGLPLVLMEALAQGLTVVSTPVGGITTLPKEIQGLYLCPSTKPHDIAATLRKASQVLTNREARSNHNRQYLLSWNQIARKAIETVKHFQNRDLTSRS